MRTLTTTRLELRPWHEDFEADLYRLSSDERVVRYIRDGRPWSREHTAERHQECLRHWAEHGFGWRAIIDRGAFTGVAALSRLGTRVPGIAEDAIEIGWWVDPGAWGRGIATEAALALRDEAFGGLGAELIVARYQLANPASGRIMEKLGMHVHSDIPGDDDRPVRFYTLDRTGWQALRTQV